MLKNKSNYLINSGIYGRLLIMKKNRNVIIVLLCAIMCMGLSGSALAFSFESEAAWRQFCEQTRDKIKMVREEIKALKTNNDNETNIEKRKQLREKLARLVEDLDQASCPGLKTDINLRDEI